MSEKDMLSGVAQKMEGLLPQILGVIYDLIEKLSGNAGSEWTNELKKFLRKEPCWVGAVRDNALTLLTDAGSLVVDAISSKSDVIDAEGIFTRTFFDYRELKRLQERGCEKEMSCETRIDVYRVDKKVSFPGMFTSITYRIDEVKLTWNQIVSFCAKYHNWLCFEGTTNFLFKNQGEYFVAMVKSTSGGALELKIRRYASGVLYGGTKAKYQIVVSRGDSATH